MHDALRKQEDEHNKNVRKRNESLAIEKTFETWQKEIRKEMIRLK